MPTGSVKGKGENVPGEPHTQMHTGVEEHGAFGALPETVTAEHSTGMGVCARLCASNRLVRHKSENGTNAGD